MRHEKANNLLQLALELQANRGGLTLDDIEEKFDVGRRTAMRMKDAVLEVFPQIDEIQTDDRKKRWRLPKGTLDRLVGVSADELGDIEVAVNVLKQGNLLDQAASLEGVLTKLRAVMSPDMARRVETDLDALLEAEGLAMRPGPKPRTKPTVLEDLRSAVKACQKVEIQYRNRTTRRINKRIVHPYGFLYGHRHYLVAYNQVKGAQGYRLFSLPNIERVVPMAEYYERDENFSLEAFSQQSFGVFQEAPFQVVWRFSPRAAADAEDFLFHPEQEIERQHDGSLIVRFVAGGALEMCWHLYAWGDDVEVLEPQALRDMVSNHRQSWPGLP
jgi:predicted DNA-binding transcriptional regulator YafY